MYGALVISNDSSFLSQAKRFITNVNRSITVQTLDVPSKAGEALRSAVPIDVVVCEHNPPYIDAIAVFNEMNRVNDMRPFIIMTNKADGDVAIKAFELRMDYYVSRENVMNFYMDLASKIVLCAERRKMELDRSFNDKRMNALMNLIKMRDKDFGEILNYALEESVSLTKSTIGYIAMYEEDTRKLKMAAWSRGGLDQCKMENRQITYDFDSAGIWGEPIRQRRAIIVNDYPAEKILPKNGLPHGHVQLNRLMMIPITHNGRILATAGVGNKTLEYTTEDRIQFTLLMDGLISIYHERMLEKENIRSERNLKDILRNAPVGIMIIDSDLSVIEANDYSRSMLSFQSLNQFNGPMNFGSDDLSHLITKDIEKVRESGYNGEFEHTLEKDGRNQVFKINVAKTKGKNNEDTGFIVIIDDVSELASASRVHITAMERINLLDRLINDDIRSILGDMEKGVVTLAESVGKKEMIRGISALNDIMTFVKEYHDVGILDPKWQDMQSLVQQATEVNRLDPQMVSCNARGIKILADPSFYNVFSQLMSYSFAGETRVTKCSVKCRLEDGDLLVYYSDDGIGIQKDKKEDFVSGTTMNYGRGIYLAFNILRACGFPVKETGTPGEGIIVEIRIPSASYSISWE